MPPDDTRVLAMLLEQPECEWIEFKESWWDPEKVGIYLSALGNGARPAMKALQLRPTECSRSDEPNQALANRRGREPHLRLLGVRAVLGNEEEP